MAKGIVLHSIVPVRTEPREGAEQESQLLFGETVSILEETDRWLRIENDEDHVQGWVDRKMLTPMTEEEQAAYCAALQTSTARVRMPMAYAVSRHNQQTLPLTIGTRLADYAAPAQQGMPATFQVLGVPFAIDPTMVLNTVLPLNKDSLMLLSRFLLNTPYLWGGKNAFGMDCSGFVQVIFSLMGHSLPRNASQQALTGEAVASFEEAKPCDLVFFCHTQNETDPTPADARVSHVGIMLSSDTLIHCSGRVKVEKIDATGIISSEQSAPDGSPIHTHRLLSIRRLA